MIEIQNLLNGYKKFYRENYFAIQNDTLFKDIKTSQQPKTLIISCSDSRVDPAILLNSHLGEIFVVRNVANLVPPCELEPTTNHGISAAIEFAVEHLHVKHIVILGHSNCGGIKALVDEDIKTTNKNSFISRWIKIAESVLYMKKNTNKDKYSFCEQEAIKLSMNNLLTFPIVKSKVDNKSLFIHGWYFKLEDASLSILNLKNNTFEKVVIE